MISHHETGINQLAISSSMLIYDAFNKPIPQTEITHQLGRWIHEISPRTNGNPFIATQLHGSSDPATEKHKDQGESRKRVRVIRRRKSDVTAVAAVAADANNEQASAACQRNENEARREQRRRLPGNATHLRGVSRARGHLEEKGGTGWEHAESQPGAVYNDVQQGTW